ncbi:MAG: N-6 DNA methylase [Candidatus Sabulitectum sp.]|nr:N-6 DNA methylase [Candidatus Sabulitectum sp.]
MRNTNIFETITTRGSLLPSGFLMKLAGKTSEVEKTKPQDYNHSGQKLNEVISRAWNTLQVQWEHFSKTEDPRTAQTRERWLIPLFRELDYGNLKRSEKHHIDGKDYPISHTRDNVPIHLLGTQTSLDHRTQKITRQIPHSMFQEYLNKSETPTWGILSNGNKLRVLRENVSMTRQAYIEFDLQKMMEGKTYSDFVLLYLICHESRFTETTQQKQIIEAWSQTAKKDGIRALDSLRTGVKQAIEALGKGFLNNKEIREKLRDDEAFKQDYYRQLLRAVYRMIFMLTAEARNLLLNPDATTEAIDRYNKYYSITRIRNLAEKRRGTRHKDLWQALNITINKLCSTEPTEALGITPLGSFLWSTQATEDLNEATLENHYLLQAIRAITQTTKENITTRVDYRNLGSEELGSIYESLLEMKPRINADARQFNLQISAGNERKTTGSYYTPTELINELLNSALDPVIRTKKTEEEILETKICDPACGSGHFLIAAAHRMARHLAAKRTEEEEPDPDTYRTALRDIISHCIYGVDINPMSVELCKISLWLEAIEPGKPLSFLDHHIKCGNSLIGTSPTLMIDKEVSEKNNKFISIPDNAFKAITGDDKKTAAKLKKNNKQQRKATSKDMFYGITAEEDTVKLIALQVAEIDHRDDSTINQLKQKEAEYKVVTTSTIFNTEKTKADLWCAAFVQNKIEENTTPITTETIRAFKENSRSLKEEIKEEVTNLANHYQFFHWYIEFPEVFQRETEESNGFDVVLGNPPWERIKLQEKEFFAERDEAIAKAPNASARTRMIKALEAEDPTLYEAFIKAKRVSEGNSHFLRNSLKFPLCGRGDVNTYTVFAELNKDLMNRQGRVGCIVPSGIATDDTTKFYFQEIIEKKQLVSLFDIENRKKIFEAVDSRMKFCLLTLSGIPIEEAEFVFFAHQMEDLKDDEKRFPLTKEDIELLNPNTKTCPIFRTKRDAEITKGIYRRIPVLINENDKENGNPWGIKFMRMFDMSNDSGLFRTREQLESEDWELKGNIFEKAEKKYLPLYEAKMIHHYNHRFADYQDLPKGSKSTQLPRVPLERLQDPNYEPLPRYWVPEEEVSERLEKASWKHNWLLGFRDITNVTNERTVIASFLPVCGVGHTMPLIMTNADFKYVCCFYVLLSSFAFDWICRQKMGGTHLTYSYLKQLPVIESSRYLEKVPEGLLSDGDTVGISYGEWISNRVIELIFTSEKVRQCTSDWGYVREPIVRDEERRFRLQCELDAAFIHLYGVEREDMDHIMETFPIVKQKDEARWGSYKTKETILECCGVFDRLVQ